ncbi:uncharacterized protein LOC126892407 [Diabrotica virgifera virgifera]|uniref:Uncharacterized protein n=1 Tax=Diabrotica virgifera virgifera TaxID=50390 RepID=A0ABM5L629_DIAVI|nr:uncharacterized protein LOC126892407 [Diabrotica virgifera virgifera]
MYKYLLLLFAVCIVAAAVAKTDEDDKEYPFNGYTLPKTEKEIQASLFDWYKEIFTKYDESPEQKLQRIASFRANFQQRIECMMESHQDVEAMNSCSNKYKLPDGMTEDDAINIFFVKRTKS